MLFVHEPRIAPADADSLSPQRRRHGLITWGILLLIVVAAAGLRLYAIGYYALELDEFWNAELSTGRGSVHEQIEVNRIHVPPPSTSLVGAPPWWQIAFTLQTVTHPPLYSIVLRFWRMLGGDGDVGMRLLSVVCSSVAIVPIFFAVRRVSGAPAAWWTVVLTATATTPIMLAQEIRPYSFLLLLCALALWQATRFRDTAASWAAAAMFALTCLAAAMTHYFAIPLLAAIVLAVVGSMSKQSILRIGACIGFVAFVYVTFWGPRFLEQRSDVSEAASIWMKDTSASPRAATLWRLFEAPFGLLATPLGADRFITRFSFVAVAVSIVLARRRRDLRFWLILLVGSLGFVALVDLTQQTRMLIWNRYLLIACPAMFALLSSMLYSASRPWLRHAVPATALIACITGLPNAFLRPTPDARQMAAYLDRMVADGDVVVFLQLNNWEWEAPYRYAQWSHYSTRSGVRCVVLNGRASPALRRELAQARRIWVVSNRAEDMPLKRIEGAVATIDRPYSGGYTGEIIGAAIPAAAAEEPAP